MARWLVGTAVVAWLASEVVILYAVGWVSWPVVLGWALAAGVVAIVARVLPTGWPRVLAAAALLPLCVLLTWEGGLFMLPAAFALLGAALVEWSERAVARRLAAG